MSLECDRPVSFLFLQIGLIQNVVCVRWITSLLAGFSPQSVHPEGVTEKLSGEEIGGSQDF
jgi:hypothetical protein